MVTGTGPDVGKTVVASILVAMFEADYWKPIECGSVETSDTETVKKLIETPSCVHPPAYAFKKASSPHEAAEEEKIAIDRHQIVFPNSKRPLVIETAGGILVPLTLETLALDVYRSWPCLWIVVTRHYIGSINHTLLTLEALKQRGIRPLALVFNGVKNQGTEEALSHFSHIPLLGRLEPEPAITLNTIKRYATLWKRSPLYKKISNIFGTHSPLL